MNQEELEVLRKFCEFMEAIYNPQFFELNLEDRIKVIASSLYILVKEKMGETK